jgi:hypothetical protein
VFKYCKAVVITAVDVNFWNVSVVTDSVCLCTLILTLTTNIVRDFPWSDMLLLFTFEKYLLNIQDWITRGWLLIFFQVYHKFYGEKKKAAILSRSSWKHALPRDNAIQYTIEVLQFFTENFEPQESVLIKWTIISTDDLHKCKLYFNDSVWQ